MLTRVLPPLVVLAILATVAIRYAQSPERDQEKARIQARWGDALHLPRVREEIEGQIARFLTSYGNRPEDRWFGARAYMKIGRFDLGIAAVRQHAPLASAPDTTRKLGELMLRVLAFGDDESFEKPLPAAPLATLALAEGGHPLARQRLDEIPRVQTPPQFLMLYYGAYMRGTEDVKRILIEALRTRTEREHRIAAAFAALGPRDYPQRQEDLQILLELVRGTSRTAEGQRPMWAASCFALGRSGDADARLVLQGALERLSGSRNDRDAEDRGILGAALVASGDWEAEGLVWPEGSDPVGSLALSWYAEACVFRYQRGDASALVRMQRIWRDAPPDMAQGVRMRMATKLLLLDEMPPEELPVEAILEALLVPQAPPGERMVARAFQVRRKDPGALAILLDEIRTLSSEAGLQGDPATQGGEAVSALITGARALYLYSGSSGH